MYPDNGASVMLRINQARAFARVLSIVVAGLFVVGSAGGAHAKARSKKIAVSGLSLEEPAAPMVAAPVRFFTINQVLAKQAGQATSRPGTVALAALTSQQATVVDGSPISESAIPAVSEEPFGLFTFRAPEGLLWTKWRGVEARMRDELKAVADCEADGEHCPAGARKFLSLANGRSDLKGQARVEAINRSLNEVVRYAGDYQQHGVADLWSSPLETLSAGAGDCEDYAIAKYAMLSAAGFPEADLKILLVRDRAVRQDHAVLGIRLDGRWLVLDNRYSGVSEARDLPHFTPLFAIDRLGVSLFAAPYAERVPHESEMDIRPAAAVSSLGGGATLPLLL